jgi:hypothetical protein
MERVARLQSLLLHVSQFPHRIPLIKAMFHLLKGPRKEESLHVPQKTGTLWKQKPISRALLSISSGVPSKGALPPGSPHTAPFERCPVSRTHFHTSFRVPSVRVPFQDPQRGPYRVRCQSPQPSFTYPPGSPVKADTHITCRSHAAPMPFPCHAVPLRV